MCSIPAGRECRIADGRAVTVEVCRPCDNALPLAQIVRAGETLGSPLPPGFAAVIDSFLKL